MSAHSTSGPVRGTRVTIACPAGPRGGNRITALRWAKLLRALGCLVRIEDGARTRACDVLIALHARRSAAAIERFAREQPGSPLIVVGAGTDLTHDLPGGGAAAESVRASLARATRVVVLHPLAIDHVPQSVVERTRVVYQSHAGTRCEEIPPTRYFDVCVVANLRPVKDPLLVARAARHLPAPSRIRVLQIGAILEPELGRALEREVSENPRLRYLGALPRTEALRTLGRAQLCVCPSRLEGGPNIITEALAMDVPLLASRIPGCEGLLGTRHAGLFPAGDEQALARLLSRTEDDADFLQELRTRGRARAWITDPALERRRLESLLVEAFAGVAA